MEIKNESVLVMDFGGQYTQLIARRVRECNVYCEIKPYKITADEIEKRGYKGIIFTGGPNRTITVRNAIRKYLSLGYPCLGYAMVPSLWRQLLAER